MTTITDPTYDPQLDDAFSDGAAPEQIDADDAAEAHARSLRYWREHYDVVSARFDEEVARLISRAEKTLEGIKRRQQWHEASLKMYYQQRGERRLVLANATLTSHKGRERIEVSDLDTLAAWASSGGHDNLLTHRVDADKAAIMTHIKATGEEPPGVSLKRGDDAFRVKF